MVVYEWIQRVLSLKEANLWKLIRGKGIHISSPLGFFKHPSELAGAAKKRFFQNLSARRETLSIKIK